MVFEIYGIEHTEASPAIRWKGAPIYHGVYLKPSYLEFREIASPTLIDWKVGDYVEYTRTGYTYKLYSIPQPTKKAAANGCGESFVYSNVQLYADTKQLEICPFRDLVYRDSAYYFSTLNSVSTFENANGIALRIKKNLLELFGANSWDVVLADDLPSDLHADESREFTLNGGNCLDALDRIYNVWPGLGWTFSVVSGTPTITIGGANVRTSDNTTNLFKYGFENGLTMIKRTQANLDTFCTRLYAYGSSRNMPARYYNNLDIYQKDNVYIPNLMLPFTDGATAIWGKTSGKYDASTACLSNSAAIAVYGVIPKTIYYDGTEDEEIYPSIANVTLDDVRAAMSPSDPFYPTTGGTTRVDQVASVISQPSDDGTTGQGGSKYVEEADVAVSSHGSGPIQPEHHETTLEYEYKIVQYNFSQSGIGSVTFQTLGIEVSTGDTVPDSVTVYCHVKHGGAVLNSEKIQMTPDEEGTWFTGYMPQMTFGSKELPVSGMIECWIQAEVDFPSETAEPEFAIINEAGMSHWGLQSALSNTFKIEIPNIGFDMMARAALSGSGNPSIAFTDGMLVGRSFAVKSATYNSFYGTWQLEVYRGEDTSVGMLYPNASYPVAAGDHFVLLDIAMPPSYVGMAANRLLTAAKAKLAELSKIQPFYEPSVDAKQVLNNITENPDDETYILREGKYMHITDADVVLEDEYVIIDTLTISENETPIPTYKVTLRERKKESFQQSIESSIRSLTSVVSTNAKQQGAQGGGGSSDHAKEADHAIMADTALSAEYAGMADSAGYATDAGTADYATTAGSAATATDADKWDGHHFADYLDPNQPLRPGDNVAFNKLTTPEVVSPNYSELEQLGFRMIATPGGSSLVIDDITVRRSMTVFELIIQQIKHQGGVFIFSAAGMEISRVENVSGGYKCYFDTKDGRVPNEFEVNDLARCQRIWEQDVQSSADYKFYWRKVTAVGEDYVVLSNLTGGYAVGSGVPEAGDVIVQLGNTTDTDRQAAQVISCVNFDSDAEVKAPYMAMYYGIHTFSLEGTLQAAVGMQEIDGELKPKMTVYGEMYVGDRDETSYMAWDAATPMLKIKGAINVSPNGDTSPNTCYRGAWASGSKAYYGDLWTYDGSTWLCINPDAIDVAHAVQTAPNDRDGNWVIYAKKGDTGSPGTPGTPGTPGAPGSDGDNGYSSAEVTIYKNSINGAPTDKPDAGKYYFATGEFVLQSTSGTMHGWSQTMTAPTAIGEVIYVRKAYVTGNGVYENISPSDWSDAARFSGWNGNPGAQGLQGKVMRGINEFVLGQGLPSSGENFQGLQDVESTHIYYDVVYLETSSGRQYYYCNNSVYLNGDVVDEAKDITPGTNPSVWVLASNFNFIATRVLLASNAFIDVFSGNAAYMYDDSAQHKIVAGMQGGDGINFFAGTEISGEPDSEDLEDAKFRVYASGRMVAREGIFAGNVWMPYTFVSELPHEGSTHNVYYIADTDHAYLVSDGHSSYGSDGSTWLRLPNPVADLNGFSYDIVVEPNIATKTSGYDPALYLYVYGLSEAFRLFSFGTGEIYGNLDSIKLYGGHIKLVCIPYRGGNTPTYIWAVTECTGTFECWNANGDFKGRYNNVYGFTKLEETEVIMKINTVESLPSTKEDNTIYFTEND